MHAQVADQRVQSLLIGRRVRGRRGAVSLRRSGRDRLAQVLQAELPGRHAAASPKRAGARCSPFGAAFPHFSQRLARQLHLDGQQSFSGEVASAQAFGPLQVPDRPDLHRRRALDVALASLGIRSVDELIGRVDLLRVDEAIDHWKARGVDLTHVLAFPEDVAPDAPRRRVEPPPPVLEDALDWTLVEESEPALTQGVPVRITTKVRNVNRTVGGILSSHIARAHGAAGLPDDTIDVVLPIAIALRAFVNSLLPSRQSGYADAFDGWSDTLGVGAIEGIAMGTTDPNDPKAKLIINIRGTTINGASADVFARDVIVPPTGTPELLYLANGGIVILPLT